MRPGTFAVAALLHVVPQATARASQVRVGAAVFSAAGVNDGQSSSYWATDDGVTSLPGARPQVTATDLL